MDAAPVRPPQPRTAARLPLIAWRALIAGLAWWGLLAALAGDLAQLKYFSQVTTLTVALTATVSIGVLAVAVDSTSARWARRWPGAGARPPPTRSSPR